MSRRFPNQYNGEDFYSSHIPDENEDMINGLKNKVTELKSLSLDMGDEIKEHNRYLKDMDNDFDSTWGSLSASMNRLKRIANAGHNRYILYLLLFSFFVFFVIYIIMKFR